MNATKRAPPVAAARGGTLTPAELSRLADLAGDAVELSRRAVEGSTGYPFPSELAAAMAADAVLIRRAKEQAARK